MLFPQVLVGFFFLFVSFLLSPPGVRVLTNVWGIEGSTQQTARFTPEKPKKYPGAKSVKKPIPLTTSETVFGKGQVAWEAKFASPDRGASWQPKKPIAWEYEAAVFFNDQEDENEEEENDSEPAMDSHYFPYDEYWQTMADAIRYLAFGFYHGPQVFPPSVPNLVPDFVLKKVHVPKTEIMPKSSASESLTRVCEVLFLSGIHYDACKNVPHQVLVASEVATSPWSKADEHGIIWREVREGKHKGCRYYMKADTVPLKMTATPNEDGSSKLSYFSKNTIGKICPGDDSEEKIQKLYQELADEIQPSKLATFFNTELLYGYNMFDALEFVMLLHTCFSGYVTAFKDPQHGPPRPWSLGLFVVAYSLFYSYYRIFIK